MNRKKIATYLTRIINERLIEDTPAMWNSSTDFVHKVYEGYISAFGVSLNQLGVLPTLAIYHSDKSKETGTGGGDKPKKPILEILRKLMLPEDQQEELLDYAASLSLEDERRLKYQLMDAAVALKIAIRTFDLQKEN